MVSLETGLMMLVCVCVCPGPGASLRLQKAKEEGRAGSEPSARCFFYPAKCTKPANCIKNLKKEKPKINQDKASLHSFSTQKFVSV